MSLDKKIKKRLEMQKYLCYTYIALQKGYRGVVQLVERQSPKLHVQSSSLCAPAKKSKSKDLDFFICVRRTQHRLRACTQHRLTEGQHHSVAGGHK